MQDFSRSIENQLIIQFILESFNKSCVNKLHSYNSTQINWENVLEQSNVHGVTALVYLGIINQTEYFVPSTIIKQFKYCYYRNVVTNQTRLDRLNVLLKFMQNIEIIMVKGPAIEMIAYKFGTREYADVDIIIHSKDWNLMQTILYQHNYCEIDTNFSILQEQKLAKYAYSFRHIRMNDRDFSNIPLDIEIHWNLFDLGILHNRDTDVWSRTMSLPNFQSNVHTLAVEDLIVYLCVHMIRHNFGRLKQLVDILALIEHPSIRINWLSVIQTYRDKGVGTCIYYGLLYTKLLFNCQIPPWVLSELRPKLFRRTIFGILWNERKILHTDISEFNLNTLIVPMLILDKLSDKFKYIKARIWPPDELIACEFPKMGSSNKAKKRIIFLYILLYKYLISRIFPRSIVEQINKRIDITK